MDELLKAYADKRRQDAGAPLELHPATHRLLQGEVARVYAKGSTGSWVHRLLLYWPRIAFATACVVVTLMLVLFMLPQQTVTEMAQTKPEVLSRDSRAVADDKETEEVRLADAFNQPAPVASTAPVTADRKLDRLAKAKEGDEAKAVSELNVEARKDGGLLREESLSARAKNVVVTRQYYANNADASGVEQQKRNVQLGAQLQNVQPVLNNFHLEQSGNELRFIDADGSIYSGNLVSEKDLKKEAAPARPSAPAAVAGAAGFAEQNVFFRAVGTNRSLQQRVSIEGNILQIQTNALPGLAPATGVNQRVPAQQSQTIRGRAQVGKSQEVQIEAVPAQPQP